MSSRELIESLRCAGEAKLSALRQDAEQEADALRSAAGAKLAELRKSHVDQLAAAAEAETSRALAVAEKKARSLRRSAEQELSSRLLAVARSLLHELRDDGYPAVFEKLALELPPLPWKLVRVGPADVKLARTFFPDAEIVPVETITGGMDASLPDGSIRIVNTFEKRLERAWNELVPLFIRNIYGEASHGTAQESR